MTHPDQIKKILVIKLCCLGDILFMTPTLSALKTAYPDASIDFLASSWVADLLTRLTPRVRHIRWDGTSTDSGYLAGSAAALRLVFELKKNRYDLVLIGHRAWPFSALTRIAGIPVRAGFSNRWADLFLTHKTTFDARAHETRRYLRIAESLGIMAPTDNALRLKPAPGDEQAAQRLLQDHGASAIGRPVCIFPGGGNNPGTSMPIKRWPHGYHARLIEMLLSRTRHTVLLLGDANDRQASADIVAAITPGRKDRLIDLTGKTGFAQLTGLLCTSRLTIGADSGPLHMSAALSAPTLLLFGPSDPRLVAPTNKGCRYLWKQVDCAPCYTPVTVTDPANYRNREFLCHTGTHACLDTLDVDEVFTTAMDMLDHG